MLKGPGDGTSLSFIEREYKWTKLEKSSSEI